MSKPFMIASVALVAAVVAAGRRIRPGVYVGLDHPTGELSLMLERNHRFTLRLAVWDAVVNEYTGTRELAGEWKKRGAELELCAPGRTLVYAHASGAIGGWVWRRSSLPTFADGFALVPERRMTRPVPIAGERRLRVQS